MTRIDSGFPSLLVFFHDIADGSDIAEGSDARFELIEERFMAFLLVLRVSVRSSSHNR
jgi:hypothetical protein